MENNNFTNEKTTPNSIENKNKRREFAQKLDTKPRNNKNRKNSIESNIIKNINQNKGLTNETQTKKQITNINIFKKLDAKVKIIPLGGLQEIGKNITVVEYEDEIIVIDCGLAFPEDDLLGVDLVIPDITYLEKNKAKIKALIITHGHEDHIGAIPYLLRKINIPVYATKLTLGLIEVKLEEHKLLNTTKRVCVEAGQIVNFGKMNVEFIRTTHSIADSVGLAIYTPAGIIVHTGDFKVDYTPIDSKPMDFTRFADIGKQGVLALMSDSTNAERKGYTMSESSVGEVFDDIFMNCTKRIIIATFASNIHRLQQVVNSAVKFKRKVAVIGRSMLNIINVATQLGYINIPEGTLIEIDKIGIYNPEQLVIISTGSQGEPMSALARMAAKEHKKVEITEKDLIIFSSSPIPGNEKFVGKVIDDLLKLGAEVIYNSLADIHVSGHACQEELKLMLSLVKPKYFIPVHGEYRHLEQHSILAKKLGMRTKDIFIMSNGKVLELSEQSAKAISTVPSGRVFVDGLGVGDVGNIVIRDRQHLSEDGIIVVVMTLDKKTGKLVAGPDVVTRGFVYVRESENLMEEIKHLLKDKVEECTNEGIAEWSTIKNLVKDTLGDYVYSKTKRDPMILPVIMEV